MRHLLLAATLLLAPGLLAAQSDIFAHELRYHPCEAGGAALRPGAKPPSADLNGTYRYALDTTVIYIYPSFSLKGGRLVKKLLSLSVIESGKAPLTSPKLLLGLGAKLPILSQADTLPIALLLDDSITLPGGEARRPRFSLPITDGLLNLVAVVTAESFSALVASDKASLLIAGDTLRLDRRVQTGVRVLYLAAHCGWEYKSAN